MVSLEPVVAERRFKAQMHSLVKKMGVFEVQLLILTTVSQEIVIFFKFPTVQISVWPYLWNQRSHSADSKPICIFSVKNGGPWSKTFDFDPWFSSYSDFFKFLTVQISAWAYLWNQWSRSTDLKLRLIIFWKNGCCYVVESTSTIRSASCASFFMLCGIFLYK